MDHFLITRFNIRVKGWETTRDGHTVNESDWLEHRYDLFERFCLPSVRNQSEQDFKWLVFFDSETPERFKNKNASIGEQYSNFQPIYIQNIDFFIPELEQRIRNTGKDEFIITSRIDNDDLIHKNFISAVRRNAKPSEELIIDFENGYQLIEQDGSYEVRNYTHLFNPFVSLVERRSALKTVMSKNHRDWKNAQEVAKPKERVWIEHVHAQNKLNAARFNLTMAFKRDFTDFGIQQNLKLSSSFTVLMTNAMLKVKRAMAKVSKTISGK